MRILDWLLFSYRAKKVCEILGSWDYAYVYTSHPIRVKYYSFGSRVEVLLHNHVVYDNSDLFAWKVPRSCQCKVIEYMNGKYLEAKEKEKYNQEKLRTTIEQNKRETEEACKKYFENQ